MSSLESLRLELLELRLLEDYARSQERRRARLKSLEEQARVRITCGVIRLVLFAGLIVAQAVLLWRLMG